MTDREKLEKIYEFVKQQEDYFYDRIDKHEIMSVPYFQCLSNATQSQKIRYFIDELMEK